MNINNLPSDNIENIIKCQQNDIESSYKTMNDSFDELYEFILVFYDYLYTKHNYGDGIPRTMIEIHILTEINDNPGTTITNLARKWHRTTSAVSQIIKNYVNLGLVTRSRNKKDGKINNLFITKKGKELVNNHKKYDIEHINDLINTFLEQSSVEEIKSFFKLVSIFKNNLLEE